MEGSDELLRYFPALPPPAELTRARQSQTKYERALTRKFAIPIRLKDPRELAILAEARALVQALPKHRQQSEAWLYATALMRDYRASFFSDFPVAALDSGSIPRPCVKHWFEVRQPSFRSTGEGPIRRANIYQFGIARHTENATNTMGRRRLTDMR